MDGSYLAKLVFRMIDSFLPVGKLTSPFPPRQYIYLPLRVFNESHMNEHQHSRAIIIEYFYANKLRMWRCRKFNELITIILLILDLYKLNILKKTV